MNTIAVWFFITYSVVGLTGTKLTGRSKAYHYKSQVACERALKTHIDKARTTGTADKRNFWNKKCRGISVPTEIEGIKI